jgi:DNA-binding transcriptional ArsR family regulator
MTRRKRRSHSKGPATAPSPPKPAWEQHPLITRTQAAELVGLFKILANDSRLRLLHALVRDGELCVTDLARTLGMKPQAVSNQLQRLVDRGILGSTRRGNHIYYRIVDPSVPNLLAWHLQRSLHPHRP